ncbi:MAG: hypothetical protein PWP23_189 [Candidatus Sumerlaeota bacterium]|nr:hypothetical protein [Candidatus Sumerlaeota bacterium]
MTSRLFQLVPVLLAVLLGLTACDRQQPQQTPAREIVQYVPVPKASVTGTITLENGNDPGGIIVYAEGTSHLAVTDRTGFFELSELDDRAYILRALRADLETLELGDVIVAPEDLQREQPFLDLGEFTMKPGGFIAAVKSPLERAGLGTLQGRINPYNPLDAGGIVIDLVGTSFRTVSDQSGSFLLLNVPQGRYSLRFRKPGYLDEERPVEIFAGQTTDLAEVLLAPRDPGTVLGRTILGTVTLFGPEGEAVTDYNSVLVSLEGTTFSTRPDGTGIFEFSNLQPDVFTVVATAEGYTLDRAYRVDLGALDIAEVSLTLRAEIPEGALVGSVIGQATLEDSKGGGNSGITVALSGTNFLATTDDEGFFALEDVPPGTYELTASRTGYEPVIEKGITVAAEQQTVAPPIELKLAIEAPRIVATRPASGASDISIEDPTRVLIIFSTKMDRASLLDALAIAPDVEYSASTPSDDRFEIRLAGYTRSGTPLRYGTKYTIRLSTKARSAEGVALKEPFSMNLTTGEAKIVRTWPEDGDTSVFPHTTSPVRVFFNAPVDGEGFEPRDVSIRPALALNPNVYFGTDGKTGWGHLNISGVFEADEEYTITIRGRVKTLTGDRITNIPYSFSFKTAEQWEGLNRFGNMDRRDRLREEEGRK